MGKSKTLTTMKPSVPYEVVQSFEPIALYFKYMSQENLKNLPGDVLNAVDTLCQYTGVKL